MRASRPVRIAFLSTVLGIVPIAGCAFDGDDGHEALCREGADLPLVVSPSTLDFGCVPVGVADARMVEITNAGGCGAIRFHEVFLAGDYEGFEIPVLPRNALEEGETMSVLVTYRPANGELHRAELLLKHDLPWGETRIPIQGGGRHPSTSRHARSHRLRHRRVRPIEGPRCPDPERWMPADPDHVHVPGHRGLDRLYDGGGVAS